MQKFIKAIVLAATLALPALFASNAFATIESCGTNCTSASPNPHGYTAATPTNCYSCHTAKTTGGNTSGGTSGGTLTVKPTSKSCGACAVGTAPMSVGAHKNVTATTLCSVCHTSTSTGGSTGGTVGIYPTRHSCGACVIGTAPGSVSAHKNVNTNNTVCSACHMATTGGTGGSTGGHTDNDHGTTGGNTGSHQDNDHRPTSPGNSNFGHSHKQNNGQHRGNDD